jgi:hypothetical protein
MLPDKLAPPPPPKIKGRTGFRNDVEAVARAKSK